VLLLCLFLLRSIFHVYISNSSQSFSRSRKSLTRRIRAVIDLLSVFPRAAPNCETSVRRWKVTQALPGSVNFNIHSTQLVRISNPLTATAPCVCIHILAARPQSPPSTRGQLRQVSEGQVRATKVSGTEDHHPFESDLQHHGLVPTHTHRRLPQPQRVVVCH